MRTLSLVLFVLVFGPVAAQEADAAAGLLGPNFVVILIDDMGLRRASGRSAQSSIIRRASTAWPNWGKRGCLTMQFNDTAARLQSRAGPACPTFPLSASDADARIATA